MNQDSFWADWEDQDLDAYLTARVEALLIDPQFLAWLDQQEADSTGRSQGSDRHTATDTRSPCGRGRTTTAVARSCGPQRGAREPPAGSSHPQGGLMKVIIAGSRTFTDYQRLCQVLAPERHRITQILTCGARGADHRHI
jgi:hypothetical protein